MNLKERRRGGVDWIHLTQGKRPLAALVVTTMNFWCPQNAANILKGYATTGFSKRTWLQ
jgi:hypothetical protein